MFVAIKNGQSRETGNTGYTRRRQTKHNHNTICVGHHYMQTSTNNVNKTGGKNDPNIVFYAEIVIDYGDSFLS